MKHLYRTDWHVILMLSQLTVVVLKRFQPRKCWSSVANWGPPSTNRHYRTLIQLAISLPLRIRLPCNGELWICGNKLQPDSALTIEKVRKYRQENES